MKRAPQDQDLLKILKEMESFQEQYPEELFSARRASFLEQVAQSAPAEAEELPGPQERDVLKHLRSLAATPAQYPPRLLAARRSALVRRIVWLNLVSVFNTAWQAIQNRISSPAFPSRIPASLVAAGLVLAAFVGYLFYENQSTLPPASPARSGSVQSGQILTSNTRVGQITCKPGAQPPLCLAGEYNGENVPTSQKNGLARPAVAKDTATGSGALHKAANVNDGMYGPGTSWISNSRNSWIKIDLGKATKINTVSFGRDRLGELSGHDPGQFVVSLAVADDVYADGNNNNDIKEYRQVFNSKQAGFSGRISGAETVTAQFKPQVARYIKITFENKGTVIDEVEAFMAEPPLASSAPGSGSRQEPPTDSLASAPTQNNASSATVTSQPVDTATPLPTATPVPSDTFTPVPTATDVPTNTPVLTNTPVPSSTTVPTYTPTTLPSDTPLPPSTSTPLPPFTETLVPTESAIDDDMSPKPKNPNYLTRVPAGP